MYFIIPKPGYNTPLEFSVKTEDIFGIYLLNPIPGADR
jgi:hypothetical protein